MNTNVQLTVFTPAYNRADTLERCYKSLQRQSCKDFEWLIIDDGSKDNTADVVKRWQGEKNDFSIRYIYKENGGLHTAYNKAIENMDTELAVCIDSDDYMPDNAVEIILDFWNKNGSDEYAGITGLDFDANTKENIGGIYPEQKSINLIDVLMGRYPDSWGDKKHVVRTELYKKYAPMKAYDGEKNFNPHCLHLMISQEKDFLILNENLCFVDYQPDGMTNNMLWQYYNSPNSFADIRLLYLSFPNSPLKFRIKHSIHYCSSCILAKRKGYIKRSPNSFLAFICTPFGFMLSRYIKHKNKNRG